MTKLSRPRQYTYHKQRYHPIFCSTSEVEMPHLIQQYLHNASEDTSTTRNHHKLINNELNANLEQILRTYLSQFWRHEVEKEQSECSLWDEITGFTPRLRHRPPNKRPSDHLPPYSQSDSQWWKHPSFAQDEGPSPVSSQAKLPLPSSTSPSSSASSSSSTVPLSLSALSPSLCSPNTPNSSSSSDISPGSSPYAGSLHAAHGDARSTHAQRTRWQLYAERLFALLLRIPYFSLNIHMQRLIHVHQEANTRKDTQLADIVRNYLTTVLQ